MAFRILRILALPRRSRLALIAAFSLAVLGANIGLKLPQAAAQSELSFVVKVNGEPITSYDVSQRQKLLALISGTLGQRMRALLQDPATQQRFRQFVEERRPQSQDEATALQKEFVERLQVEVMGDITQNLRSSALDELIDEKLIAQEAARRKITVTEAEVDQQLLRMARGSGDADRTVEDFLSAFTKQGIDARTMRDRVRSQIVWRETIRRLFGSRISAAVTTTEPSSPADQPTIENTNFDVLVVRIAVPSGADDVAMARFYARSETLRRQFSSCGQLSSLVNKVDGATLQTHEKKLASFFPANAHAMLLKARAGEMLPPLVTANAIDLYAVCNKSTQSSEAETAAQQQQGELRQQEFERYARRHLLDLKQDALIERR
jgi:peptidyl-prolyl cis-trans isomerase SurA